MRRVFAGEPFGCVEVSFTSSMLYMLWMVAQICTFEHILSAVVSMQLFSQVQKQHQKYWKNEEISGKKMIQSNRSDWPKKKKELKVKFGWLLKKVFKKTNFAIISLLKKKFSIGLVSRRSIFEVKVLKEFVKTLLFNVRVRLTWNVLEKRKLKKIE